MSCSKKTVVFLRSNPVNPDSRVEKQVSYLSKEICNVIVLAWDRESDYKEKKEFLFFNDDSVSIHRRGIKASFGEGKKNLIPFLKFQLFLFRWLICNMNSYNIIHACDFDTAFTAMIVSFFTRKKLVFDIFDYLSTDAKTIFQKGIRFLENSIINYAKVTIICNEDRKKQISKTKPKKLVIIHNTPEKIENEFIQPCSKVKIVYVGILQDYRLLLEMVKCISKRNDCELHIAGFGKYESDILQFSNNYENVYFYGRISYEKTIQLEKKCDIMTAIYDPQIGNHIYAAPNKFYEALMLGKPLIMVKGTGMAKVVSQNNIGICIDYDELSFDKGLSELLEKQNEWKEMHIKMKKIYMKSYSWDIMQERLKDIYTNI